MNATPSELRARSAPVVRDDVLKRLATATEALLELARDVLALYAIPMPDEDAIEVEPATTALRLRCPICRDVFDEQDAEHKRGMGGAYMVPPCGHQIFVEP